MAQQTAADLLREWCDALARLDVDAALALCDEQVVVLAPFVPAPVPARMEGRETFAAAFRPVFALFTGFRWTALDVQAAADPTRASATASAAITLVDGRPYRQDYAMFITASGGRITRYTEYMDPVRAGEALAGLAPGAAAGGAS